jgi:hypothetical protein
MTPEELATFIALVIVYLIVFFVGTAITQWYAGRRKWDKKFSTAFVVNLLWLIFNIIFSFFLIPLLSIIVNLIVGVLVVKVMYNKEFFESFWFVVVVLIVMFFVYLILFFLLVATLVVLILPFL